MKEKICLKYKNKYISDYKSGIKYSVKELVDEVFVENNEVKSNNTVVDKLFELVGEDCVEIK